MGKYGPMVQLGKGDDEEKIKFSSIPKGKSIADVTLQEALVLLKLPRTLGKNEEGIDVHVNIGQYGPYIRVEKEFHSLPSEFDVLKVELQQALNVIRKGRENRTQKD